MKNHRLKAPLAAILFMCLCSLQCLAALPPPSHIKPGAVIYGVVPPFFGREPFKDVTSRLDRLRDLGVDILWLSPVNSTDDPSGISYSITDYFRVRPDFGRLEDLKDLVSEAHRRGIRVIMDFVPNHTSKAHPYFIDAEKQGKSSPYYDFYDRDGAGRITHYFDWEGLPNLNYSNPEVATMMNRAFRYWIESVGIDGFRVDVAWGLRRRAPDVWGPLIRRLRAIKPDLIMLAEAGARDPYYVQNGFDLAYDWTDKLGQWAWRSAFEDLQHAGRLLQEALTAGQDAPQTVARFLNNNDTGPRFITRYGLAATRAAAVLQHTLPGVPIVYTGDEVGAEYEPYEDPPPISWEDKYGLRGLYKKLAELREALPAIYSGDFTPLHLEGDPSAFAFLRRLDEANWALVAVNLGPAAQVSISLPNDFASLLKGAALCDALKGALRIYPEEAPTGVLKMTLRPFDSKILVPASGCDAPSTSP